MFLGEFEWGYDGENGANDEGIWKENEWSQSDLERNIEWERKFEGKDWDCGRRKECTNERIEWSNGGVSKSTTLNCAL